MNKEELEKALLEAEKAVLILKLGRMLADIRIKTLESIKDGDHLLDKMGELQVMNHEKFLEKMLESYMDNEMF